MPNLYPLKQPVIRYKVKQLKLVEVIKQFLQWILTSNL